MDKEIKFRGIHTHVLPENEHLNGAWIYGYLCGNGCYIEPEEGVEQLIDCDTVGQYIGLSDKNGRDIYEGDIVLMHQFLFDGNEYENEIKGVVSFLPELACFTLKQIRCKPIENYTGYAAGEFETPICNFYGLHEESWTILGNIWENPELLDN